MHSLYRQKTNHLLFINSIINGVTKRAISNLCYISNVMYQIVKIVMKYCFNDSAESAFSKNLISKQVCQFYKASL